MLQTGGAQMAKFAIIGNDGRGYTMAVVIADTIQKAKSKWAREYIRGAKLLEYAHGSFTAYYDGAPARFVCKAKRLPSGT
jgi:hypothetical protein